MWWERTEEAGVTDMEAVIYSVPQFCNDLLLIWQGGREIFNKCITAHSLISMRFATTSSLSALHKTSVVKYSVCGVAADV